MSPELGNYQELVFLSSKLKHEVCMKTEAGYTCQVDFTNDMNDGSYISGIVAMFTYVDNTQSTSNNPNVNIQYGGVQSLYSNDKCVTRIGIDMALRRPDGTVQILPGDSGPVPADKCFIHEGWTAAPATQISMEEGKKLHLRSVRLIREFDAK
jgi:hypothetical protein